MSTKGILALVKQINCWFRLKIVSDSFGLEIVYTCLGDDNTEVEEGSCDEPATVTVTITQSPATYG